MVYYEMQYSLITRYEKYKNLTFNDWQRIFQAELPTEEILEKFCY